MTDDIFFEQNSESIDMIFYGSNWAKGEGGQNGAPSAGQSAFFKMSLKLDPEVQAREVKAKKDKRRSKKIVAPDLPAEVGVLQSKDQAGVLEPQAEVGVLESKDQARVLDHQEEIDKKHPGPAFHPIVSFSF